MIYWPCDPNDYIKKQQEGRSSIKEAKANMNITDRTCIGCAHFSTMNGFCKEHQAPRDNDDTCGRWEKFESKKCSDCKCDEKPKEKSCKPEGCGTGGCSGSCHKDDDDDDKGYDLWFYTADSYIYINYYGTSSVSTGNYLINWKY